MQDNCSGSSHEETEDIKCKEYDDLFPTFVSPLGRYQKTVFFIASSLVMLTSCQFGALLFVYGTPTFHCQSDNSTVSSCPPNKCCENCTSYVFDGPFRSIVSEWHLICDKAYVGANLQACFFVGMLVGGCIAGMVSDFFGRKKCHYIFASIVIISAFASVFADCLSLLGLLRFLMGFGACGSQMSLFTFMLELLGPKYRTLVSGVFQGYFLLGYFTTCFVSYFVRDWRSVVLITSLPGLLLFAFIRIYPESPRWLLSQNRLDEAHKVLEKCKDTSTKITQPGALKQALEDIKNAQFARKIIEEEKVYTLLDLVRTPKLRRRSIIISFNWSSVSFLSNALFLYIDDLSGNIYLNFTILNALSPMSVIVSTICTKRLGRRVTHSGILLITGLLCLVSLAVSTDDSLTKTWIFVVGAAIVSGLWVTIYLISTELFPTVLRSTAIGTGYTLGRVGAILAPYVGIVGQLPGLSTLPLIILGVVSLAAAVSAMWLPETLNSTMHQTIEEEESAKEDYSLVCCQKPTPKENDVIANLSSSEDGHPEQITSAL